jgi:hypothetical protein
MHRNNGILPDGWLAFEVGTLRRLEFNSVAIPFAGEPELGVYLKQLRARVVTNDLAQWSNAKCKALIESNGERISDAEIEVVLDGAYMPRETFYNPALPLWFNEIDAFWFDNLRDNIEKLASPIARAQALTIGMMVGDYVLSFDEDTRELRTPLYLSDLYRKLGKSQLQIVNNSHRNGCFNREARDFIAEQHTDLLFLRLPRAKTRNQKRSIMTSWREEWVRGTDDFWAELDHQRSGRLGDFVETRQQYLRLIEEFLQAATHIENWAIAMVEDGFVSTTELAECIGRVRRIEAVYTKDFSELTGARAAVIVA